MKHRMDPSLTEGTSQPEDRPSGLSNDLASGLLFPSGNNGEIPELDGGVVLDSMMLLAEDSNLVSFLDNHLYDQVDNGNHQEYESATLIYHQSNETQQEACFTCMSMPQSEVHPPVPADNQSVINYNLPHLQPPVYHERPSLSLDTSLHQGEQEPLQYHEMQPRPPDHLETRIESSSAVANDLARVETTQASSDVPRPSDGQSDRTDTAAENRATSDKDIDQAIASVLHALASQNQKELMTLLDPETLERCLQDITNHPILICHHCLENFSYVSMFHAHILSCSNVPRIETRMKTDQAAMDLLAMTLWKSVFIKMLQGYPTGDFFMKHEAEVNKELEQLWARKYDIEINLMIKCREMFLHAAVSIITRKFVKTAIANELHRVSKGVERASKVKKRPSTSKANPDPPDPTNTADPTNFTSPTKSANATGTRHEEPKETIVLDDTDFEDGPSKKAKRTPRKKLIEIIANPDDLEIIEEVGIFDSEDQAEKSRKKKNLPKAKGKSGKKRKKSSRRKVTETDRAIQSISFRENPIFRTTIRERRRERDSSQKSPPLDRLRAATARTKTLTECFRFDTSILNGSSSVRTMSSGPDSPPNLSCHLTPETSVSDRGIDVTHDIDIDDMNIEELEKIEDEIAPTLFEAAGNFEALESDAGGTWATVKTEMEAEEDDNYEPGYQYTGGADVKEEYDSEHDYVVEKILSRRPLPGKEGSYLESDYEYLVRWEGFDETEDTWEPFDHLKRCPIKMREFHDELRRKAMRSRKGKNLYEKK